MHIHHEIMLYYIVNVCCGVANNVHGLIFKVENQISKIQMLFPLYVFMRINALHFFLRMEDTRLMKNNIVNFVSLLHMQL